MRWLGVFLSRLGSIFLSVLTRVFVLVIHTRGNALLGGPLLGGLRIGLLSLSCLSIRLLGIGLSGLLGRRSLCVLGRAAIL